MNKGKTSSDAILCKLTKSNSSCIIGYVKKMTNQKRIGFSVQTAQISKMGMKMLKCEPNF